MARPPTVGRVSAEGLIGSDQMHELVGMAVLNPRGIVVLRKQ